MNPDHDPHHRFALEARAAKRAAAHAAGVDEAYIASFVERFYALVRGDERLGPIFASRVSDWPEHLDRMKSFWRSVLHNSGEYQGRPMPKHVAIDGLDDAHFERWLTLFYATLRDDEPTEAATQRVGATARNIADSLLTGIALHRHGIVGGKAGRELPHV
ncbi:group III truncated hemoglobin [Sphingomonas jaspsi]|uniref:group III truncated hemoglobin n=1 Tax=Sphingomonas jaspsi TaxID=392409 RepID=UPI0004AFD15A|nr:group III truncated hemoglobin [Sphingomonas jaspsi]